MYLSKNISHNAYQGLRRLGSFLLTLHWVYNFYPCSLFFDLFFIPSNMKHTLLFLSLLCCSGCALFKKTSKSSNVTTQSSKNQLESSQLVLKQVGKETQTFTYWTDSGFYQYQLIKERSKESESTDLTTKEAMTYKKKQTAKQSEPLKFWVYLGLLLVMLGFLFYIRRVVKL